VTISTGCSINYHCLPLCILLFICLFIECINNVIISGGLSSKILLQQSKVNGRHLFAIQEDS